MLLLILFCYNCQTIQKDVSIHLMLLLIMTGDVIAEKKTRFNTSHVTINHMSTYNIHAGHSCFNTSHVTINHVAPVGKRWNYICFNTSHVTINRVQRYNRWQCVHCFNTSHVTINLLTGMPKGNSGQFQYISCYY